MSDAELALKALLDLVDHIEAGCAAVKAQVKAEKIPEETWNPNAIKWTPAESAKGSYERADSQDNNDFRAMLTHLQKTGGQLTRENWFYWLFANSQTVGRKKLA